MAYPGIALVAMVGVGLGLALWYLFTDTASEPPHGNGPRPPRGDTPPVINCSNLTTDATRRRCPRSNNKSNDECPICTDVMDTGTSQKVKCGHVFHNVCIQKWYETVSGDNQSPHRRTTVTCPLCRRAI